MSPRTRELVRRCLVLGGPLADLAIELIAEEHPMEEINFLYPHDMRNDPEWRRKYKVLGE
jgi:hypothetical protein